jgi:drug/metabolite transporter (DMT)-like permease
VAEGLSLRRPASFLGLLTKPVWLLGFGVMAVGWLLQALALNGGRVSIVQTFLTMTLVFVLPLGWWLTGQRVTRREVFAAFVVVAGLVLFAKVGNPAQGRSDAPSWQWLLATVAVAALCAGLLAVSDRAPAQRAAMNGAVSGATAALLAVMAKPVLTELSDGIGAVLSDPKTYLVVVLAVLGVVFQQIGLGTGCLAPTVAAGSVVSPLLSVVLGALVLQETLARPAWHTLVGIAGLAISLAAAVVITLEHLKDGAAEAPDGVGAGTPVAVSEAPTA